MGRIAGGATTSGISKGYAVNPLGVVVRTATANGVAGTTSADEYLTGFSVAATIYNTTTAGFTFRVTVGGTVVAHITGMNNPLGSGSVSSGQFVVAQTLPIPVFIPAGSQIASGSLGMYDAATFSIYSATASQLRTIS